jgi:thiol-disulfide isomerase/thioredoxin
MSGLLFLTFDDFSIKNGKNGLILCQSIPGFSLILFYSKKCQHCKELLPIFYDLPKIIVGCQFGLLNISANSQVAEMSKRTIVPIEYVPSIILYVDGKPFMKYDKGPRSLEHIKRFVLDVIKNIQNKQNTNSSISREKGKKGIPQYSIGQPLCGEDGVCYLTEAELIKNSGGKNSVKR